MDASRKISYQQRDLDVPSIKLAGVLIRRKDDLWRYPQVSSYSAKEYEVLLRAWPLEPFLDHLSLFSGPLTDVEDPEGTLIVQCQNWTQRIVDKLGHKNVAGLQAIRASFIALVGGTQPTEFLPNSHCQQLGMLLCFVMPLTREGSNVVSYYPETGRFPHFHCLHQTLVGMYSNSLRLHPHTREALSVLDNWLREQHTIPNAMNVLFSPPTEQRLQRCVGNPVFAASDEDEQETPLENFQAAEKAHEEEPVEKYLRNSLFGCGLLYGDKVNTFIHNKYFGLGEPDYTALGTKLPQWIAVKVPESGGSDWVETFPMHKCACEGDVAGIRKCFALNLSCNALDSDGWAPLHYACWYGELDAMIALVEECGASIRIQNVSGSTPLHMAAGNSHSRVVKYLLEQGANLSALDYEGKSPLAVCLENRSNDWRATAAMLREAYTDQVDDRVYVQAVRQKKQVVFDPQEDVVEEVDGNVDGDEVASVHLSIRGSLINLASETEARRPLTIRKMRIDFMNGHHQLANFYNGRNTLASQVLQEVCHLVNLDMECQYLFALWIVSSSLAIQLGDTDKPLKLIGKWPSLLKKFSTAPTTEPPCLYMRRNVFYPSLREQSVADAVTLEYLYADAQRHVKSGNYPCSEEEAIDLAAISMQLTHGDYNPAVHQPAFLKGQLESLLPRLMAKSRKKADLEKRICSKHQEISKQEYDAVKLYHNYLERCRKWPYYAATFYEGNLHSKSRTFPGRIGRQSTTVLVGINNLGFHLINKDSNIYAQSYTLEEMEWNISPEKQVFLLWALDGSMELSIHSKKAALMHSLATRMKEELDNLRRKLSSNEPSAKEMA